MSKKDYILLAGALRLSKPAAVLEAEYWQYCNCCKAVALMLMDNNSAFNRSKFLETCGVPE